MRYEKYNFIESYSNANGGTKADSMLAREIGQLIAIDSVAVSKAMQEAGVDVKDKCPKKRLVNKIYANSDNKKMIENLSAMIVLKNELMNNSNFFGVDGEKTGLFSKIGNFWKNRKKNKRGDVQLDPIPVGKDLSGNTIDASTDSKDQTFFTKLGNFLNKNKETIQGVAGGLAGLIARNRGQEEMEKTSQQPYQNPYVNPPKQDSGMSTSTKVLIGVGVAGVLGLIIYLVRRKK